MRLLSDEKLETIANEVGAPTSRYFPYWRTTVDLCRAIEAAVLEAQGKQEPVASVYAAGIPECKFEYGAALRKLVPASGKPIPLYAAPVVQPDMVLVPREATPEMVSAGYSKITMEIENSSRDISDVYMAMIAAAEGKE